MYYNLKKSTGRQKPGFRCVDFFVI